MWLMRPDLSTALGMTALSALVLAWALWALGKNYWQQGVQWAVAASLLAALAFLGWTLPDVPPTIAAALLSAGLACYSLALQQGVHAATSIQVVLRIGLPVVLLLGIWVLQIEPLQPAVAAAQTMYTLWLLVHLRKSTPGLGWLWVMLAVCIQLAIFVALLYIHAQDAWALATQHTLLMWALCSLPWITLAISATGLLTLLQDRATSLKPIAAHRDALTQLPDHSALVPYLQQQLALGAKQQQPVALMLLNIDHFDSVNQLHGHIAADLVLQSMARTLCAQARSQDFVARHGSETFVVVLPHTYAHEAFLRADRLCQTVRKTPLSLPDGRWLHLTISVGVYVDIPTSSSTWERWVEAADRALAATQRSGHDKVSMSAPVQAMQTQSMAMI